MRSSFTPDVAGTNPVVVANEYLRLFAECERRTRRLREHETFRDKKREKKSIAEGDESIGCEYWPISFFQLLSFNASIYNYHLRILQRQFSQRRELMMNFRRLVIDTSFTSRLGGYRGYSILHHSKCRTSFGNFLWKFIKTAKDRASERFAI